MEENSLENTWNGYERLTDSWCAKQAELISLFTVR